MNGPGAPDYVVAGARPAGLTIARLLALKVRRVVVAGEERRDTNRLELLAPAARSTVVALGLEPLLRDKAIARPCLGIRRPEARTEYEDFLLHPNREGHVVDRARFDSCLRDAALAAGAEILPLRVTGAAPGGEALRVRTKAGAQGLLLVNGIVIDATGRTAAIARRKGASMAFRDRMVAELVEDMPAFPARHEADDAPSWLDYQSSASRLVLPYPGTRRTCPDLARSPRRDPVEQFDLRCRCIGLYSVAGGRKRMDCRGRRGDVVRSDRVAGAVQRLVVSSGCGRITAVGRRIEPRDGGRLVWRCGGDLSAIGGRPGGPCRFFGSNPERSASGRLTE
jgi:hypothetical protein